MRWRFWFALPMVVFPLPYLITHAEFRYRLILDPLLTVFAGYAIVELYGYMTRASDKAAQVTTLQTATGRTI